MLRQKVAVMGLGLILVSSGCKSGSYAEQGAVVGGLTGAGLGALATHPDGNPGAGAALGAGLGALTGAVVGSGMDQTEARNQAALSAVQRNAMTIPDVLELQSAGVADDVIATQIRNQGVIAPPTSSDLVYLQQQGVSPTVVKALQTAPQAIAIQEPVGPNVIVHAGPRVRPIHVHPPYPCRPPPRRHGFRYSWNW
jgi:outer membrane lipoprotein SlyB